jgi:2-polyprenyl-3-methyl-5-hydroxy-6-metoxy-1,4-benzoquinol methylase
MKNKWVGNGRTDASHGVLNCLNKQTKKYQISVPVNLDNDEKIYIKKSDFIVRFTNLLQFLKDNIIPGGGHKLLEVGCNTSLLDRFLKTNGIQNIHYYGVDIDTDCLLKSQKRGVKCKKCDLNFEKIPYDDDFFDYVVAFEVIEHVPFYHNMMAEIDRVIKDSGVLFLTTPNISSLGNRLKFIRGEDPHRIYNKTQTDVHFRMFNKSSILKLFSMYDYSHIYSAVLTSHKSRRTRLTKRLMPNLSDIVFCIGQKNKA